MSNQVVELNELSSLQKELLESALKVAPNAYNKYSNFYVGAAVRTISGNIYSGTFLDNSSTGLTICAEPAAIMQANTHGDFKILEIAVVGGHKLGEYGDIVTPCGRCRQIIYEASCVVGENIKVYCSNLILSKVLITDISYLLPLPFYKK